MSDKKQIDELTKKAHLNYRRKATDDYSKTEMRMMNRDFKTQKDHDDDARDTVRINNRTKGLTLSNNKTNKNVTQPVKVRANEEVEIDENYVTNTYGGRKASEIQSRIRANVGKTPTTKDYTVHLHMTDQSVQKHKVNALSRGDAFTKAMNKADMSKAGVQRHTIHEEVELDEALNLQQRQKRAQIIKRYQSKIQRSRQLAQRKMAPTKNIKKRAYAQARKLVRTRVAGKRGADYANLGPSEKQAIDKMVDNKKSLIKKLAMRLVPRVKQAETERLHSFMKGTALKSQVPAEGKANGGLHEELNYNFAEAFPAPFSVKSKRISPGSDDDMGYSNEMGKKSTSEKKDNKDTDDKDGVEKASQLKNGGKFAPGNKNIIQYSKFEEEVAADSNAFKSLVKKAESADIEIEILGEIYDRGCDAWKESYSVSQQQYAFARVNSFINQGKTYFNEDSDLQEVSTNTLKSYLSKSKKSSADAWRDKEGNVVNNPSKEATKTLSKRYKGQNTAEKKLAEGLRMSKADGERLSASVASRAKGKIIPTHSVTHTRDGIEHEFSYTCADGKRMPYKKIKGELSKAQSDKHVADMRAKFSVNEELDEGYKIGDMVNVTNPKATAQYKIVGKNKTHYHIEKPNGDRMHMPKERIARVNKQAWALRKARKEATELEELAAIPAPGIASKKWNDEVTARRWKMAADRAKARQQKAVMSEEVELDEVRVASTTYVKPHFGSNDASKQTGWKASNKHGKVKYFGKEFKHAAEKHANGVNVSEDCGPKLGTGNSQKEPKKRLVGTDSLVKTFKKDTPYSEEVDDAFGDAFGEEVRSADTKGVIVRRTDGTSYIRKQKVNRKIIKSGNLTDGRPDDEIEDTST